MTARETLAKWEAEAALAASASAALRAARLRFRAGAATLEATEDEVRRLTRAWEATPLGAARRATVERAKAH